MVIKAYRQILLEHKLINSIMSGYFCIGFIDFMIKGKSLTEFTDLFWPNNLKKNDGKILTYFMTNV